MEWQAISFDWNQVRAFLATAEEGSLSGAARALKLTQPTLSRQVASLEEELGVTLFERGPRTMILTETGHQLLEHVRAMGEAATRVSLVASGQSQTVEGRVSVTMTNTMATYHMAPVLKKLRLVAPKISVEIIESNNIQDIAKREADIAIRHVRPEQPELIAKLIGEINALLLASSDYIQRHGPIQTIEDALRADFIGFEPVDSVLERLKQIGLPLRKENVPIVTESGTAIMEYVRQGLGISILPRNVLDIYPELQHIVPSFGPVPVPIWLVTHRELHTSKRIRVVFDLIAEELGK